MLEKKSLALYLVTDTAWLQGRSLLSCVQDALEGGVTLVQYRDKQGDGRAMYDTAIALQKLCAAYNVPLIINDRVDLALAVGAAGVHLGQGDLPCRAVRSFVPKDFLIGVSAHTPEEARQAADAGADYLGCGAVFPSVSKKDTVALGLAGLKEIAQTASLPLVAIGGVTLTNYAKVLQAGAAGAAVISDLLAAADIKSKAQAFLQVYYRWQIDKV